MGSLQLDCPLCCNETFTSQQSLKYHLLSIIDNILCTICSSRFETIYELAQHLDENCRERKVKDAGTLSNFNLDNVQIKIETEDSSDEISNSILAKALLSPQKHSEHPLFQQNVLTNNENNESQENDSECTVLQNETQGEDENTNDEEIYSCSSCGISFTSILEHIEEFHAGQEVVVEVYYT